MNAEAIEDLNEDKALEENSFPGQTTALSARQAAEFHERGVLKVNFGLDPITLDRIRERVEPQYDEAYRRGELPNPRVQDAWKTVDEVRQLAVDSRVLEALEQLFGRRPLPFQTLNFPAGTRQLAHSDTIHFSTLPAGQMAGVWVALEDIDAENGPLVYYPGSHKLPYYSMQDLGLEPGYSNYPDYEQCVQKLIAEQRLEPEYGLVPKGSAIIWHANLLHGGAPQKDVSRSRHSQVTHYFFEGCEYYTPMQSSAGKPAYRDPEWIPVAGTASPRGKSLPRRIWRKLRGKLRLPH